MCDVSTAMLKAQVYVSRMWTKALDRTWIKGLALPLCSHVNRKVVSPTATVAIGYSSRAFTNLRWKQESEVEKEKNPTKYN